MVREMLNHIIMRMVGAEMRKKVLEYLEVARGGGKGEAWLEQR